MNPSPEEATEFCCWRATLAPISFASHRHTQKRGGNGGDILVWAFVLAGEQGIQLFLQIRRATVLFRGLECVHGRPVVFSESSYKFGRRAEEVERVGVSGEGNVLL